MESRTRIYGERIRALEPGKWTTLEPRLPHGGSLQARKLAKAVSFAWRFTQGGTTHREVFGVYDSSSPPKKLAPGPGGFSPAAAIEKCKELAAAHAAHPGGLWAHKEDQVRAYKANRQSQIDKERQTFGLLWETYVAHLKAAGRSSWKDANGIFALHVRAPFPELTTRAAADITTNDAIGILRRLRNLGRGRSANKARAYLKAAFQCAIDAPSAEWLPEAFIAFGIRTNPFSDTKRKKDDDRSDKNPLQLVDMQKYWRLIEHVPGLQGAALRMHLLSGAQRPAQLLRLRRSDVTLDSFVILDAKGRPGEPARKHRVPITEPMAATLATLETRGVYVFSSDDGKTSVGPSTLTGWSHEVVAGRIEGFQLKRLRSGVETSLGAAGISPGIRGRLQSHGVGGIQQKHYDDYDYMPEKRSALDTLYRLLTQAESANVIDLRKEVANKR